MSKAILISINVFLGQLTHDIYYVYAYIPNISLIFITLVKVLLLTLIFVALRMNSRLGFLSQLKWSFVFLCTNGSIHQCE